MVFSSINFLLFFLPLFLCTYFISPHKIKNYVILIFSLIFYAWGAPQFILLLVPSTLLNFFIVKALNQCNNKLKKNALLGSSLLLNLGLLAYFKYANFFIENLNFLRGWVDIAPLQWQKIILPIGISFFSFQSITYSMDVYRKVHAPLKNPFNYLLYIIMFPQMIAGPIVRFQTIADELVVRTEKWDEFLYGFQRFAIGLAKKVLIADVLCSQVDTIMSGDFTAMNSTTAWIGILAYTFQIYFDFSGYSDMAIGIGRMIGFHFPENFNNPYVSRSITEFWRRWHMTLGAWMKNYLYIPLGGNKVKTKRRLFFNLWFVFLVSGFWHGASWNFILWGAFHGFFLILDRLFLEKKVLSKSKLFSTLFTFFLAMMGWVIFRIEELNSALLYYKQLFSFNFESINLHEHLHFYTILIVATFFAFFTTSRFGRLIEQRIFYSQHNSLQHISYWLGALSLCILSIASLSGSGFSPFIYFRF